MTRLGMHRALFGWATAVSLLGILLAQTKSFNHVPDLVIWLVATFLLIAAGELLLCVFVLVMSCSISTPFSTW